MATLQGQVTVALNDLGAAILAKVNAAIGSSAYTLVPQLSTGVGAAVTVSGNPIVGLDVVTVHGKKALTLTLTSAIAVGGTSTKSVTVLAGDLQVGGVSVIGTTSNGDYTTMSKALWNYLLVKQDGSFGVHNPSFAFEILKTTQAKVAGITTSIPY